MTDPATILTDEIDTLRDAQDTIRTLRADVAGFKERSKELLGTIDRIAAERDLFERERNRARAEVARVTAERDEARKMIVEIDNCLRASMSVMDKYIGPREAAVQVSEGKLAAEARAGAAEQWAEQLAGLLHRADLLLAEHRPLNSLRYEIKAALAPKETPDAH